MRSLARLAAALHKLKAAPAAAVVAVAAACATGLGAAPALAQGYFPIYSTWAQPDGPGSDITLTYSFSNLLDGSIRDGSGQPWSAQALRGAFEAAFADYAAFLPIHFVEVEDAGPPPATGQYDPTGLADIRIGQVPHVNGANAYAYFPPTGPGNGLAGDIVFNAQRFGLAWTLPIFYAVAQHELGHSLGMGHFVAGDAAQAAPLYDGPLFPLDERAIAALQGAYGAGLGSVTPLSPVPEPATTVLLAVGVLALLGWARRRRRKAWPAARVGAALTGAALALPLAAQALTIQFDYSYDTRGFFTDLATGQPIAERRAVLDAAAAVFAPFTDQLTAISPAEGDHWSVRITHPSLGGPTVTLNNVQVAADTLVVYAGGSPSAPGVLGFANIGFDLTASGSQAFVDSVLTRGQANTTGPDASDYATWGGMMWFNETANWHFGLDQGPGAGQNDFLTTVTHELGHILGFGTAPSWASQIDAQGRFTGEASVAVFGGLVLLDSYRSHWASNTWSLLPDGTPQATLMDPSTPAGRRELMTLLDYAGFADIGWQVSPIPEPAVALLALPGVWVVVLAARRQRSSKARRG